MLRFYLFLRTFVALKGKKSRDYITIPVCCVIFPNYELTVLSSRTVISTQSTMGNSNMATKIGSICISTPMIDFDEIPTETWVFDTARKQCSEAIASTTGYGK